MSFVALALTISLALIAGIHGFWALGGVWPGQDKAELARIVVGNPRLSEMPSTKLTVIVTLLLAGIAAWPLLIAPILRAVGPGQLVTAASILIASVFLLRGFLGYSAAMRRRHSAEPFATYNRLYYSPLCLALGAGFLILAADGGMA